MMGEQPQVVDIGDISELNGSAQIIRDEALKAKVNLGIQSNDEAITTNGRMAITFLDDSTVRLTEHSELLIDEYIYVIERFKNFNSGIVPQDLIRSNKIKQILE